MNMNSDPDHFLRRVFTANAVFSALSGLVLLAGGTVLAPYFALSSGWLLMAIGVGLLLFSWRLVQNVRRPRINRFDAWTAAAGDIGWVVGSIVLLGVFWNTIPVTGKWLIALAADVVAVFAALQVFGLLRTKDATSVALP